MPIDLATAPARELEDLVGIGPALAARIVDARPLTDFEDLVAVPGIGPRMVAALRSQGVVVDDGGASDKMGPGLRRILARDEEELVLELDRDDARMAAETLQLERSMRWVEPDGLDAPLDVAPSRSKELLGVSRAGDGVKVRAFVEFTGNGADLTQLGLEVETAAHDIFLVSGTPSKLRRLARQAATLRLDAPAALRPNTEFAASIAEIAAARSARPKQPKGFSGKGVYVGVIDTDLDVTHHSFRHRTAGHRTRVEWLWVQSPHTRDAKGKAVSQSSSPGKSPHDLSPDFKGLKAGRAYDRRAIDAALALAKPYGTGTKQICQEPGKEAHGTHVAGIAAGNGSQASWAATPIHVGAAPESDLIHVSVNHNTADYLLGLRFILAVADRSGRPSVINMSLGWGDGPRAGTDSLARIMDNLINSHDGRSVVLAAGNDDDEQIAHHGWLRPRSSTSFELAPKASADRNDPSVHIWHDGTHHDLWVRVAFRRYGKARTVHAGPWLKGKTEYNSRLGGYRVIIERDEYPSVDRRGISITLERASPNAWLEIELKNRGRKTVRWRAWALGKTTLVPSRAHETTLDDSASCKSALTVGACGYGFGNLPSGTAKVKRIPPGFGELIAGYSGAGPTGDGRIKPEICAVGGDRLPVQSAASDQKSGYRGDRGTSMATPVVAGAVALLIEAATRAGVSRLPQDVIKSLITHRPNRAGLAIDAKAKGFRPVDRNRYGYGRLRVLAPLDHIAPPVDVDLAIRTADDDFGAEPYIGRVFWASPDIQVRDAGKLVTTLRWGTEYEVTIWVHNLGNSPAVDALVILEYSVPWTAPDRWTPATNRSGSACRALFRVGALAKKEIKLRWQPQRGQVQGAPASLTHFCLLAQVDHPLDELTEPAPFKSGSSAWSTNMRATNNIASRNVTIK